MTAIFQPFSFFTDKSGAPLDNGALYFGTTGLDARTNPITVYQDAALTIPWQQPISTVAGYPAYQGAPGRIYIASTDCSMSVLQNDGQVVFNSVTVSGLVDVTQSNGSSLIGFLQSGTGAVTRTVQAKLRDVVHAADYGVVGDGVTTDTAAMQVALNAAAASGRALVLPAALKTGALTVPEGSCIVPQGDTCTITTVAGTYDTFTIASSDVWINGLTLENAAKVGGADFKITCGTNTLRRIYISDIVSRDAHGVFSDSGSGAGKYIDIALRRIHTERVRGPGVVMTRMFAYIILDDVSIDYTSSAADFQGFSFNGSGLGAADAGGLRLNDLNVLGSATPYTTSVLNQRGFNVANLRSIEATNCKADGCGELGWSFFNVADGTITDCASAQCVGGLYLESCTEMRFNNWRTSGRNLGALAYKPANKDGVYFATGNDGIQFNGGVARDNTGHGINKSAAQTGGVLFSGFRSVFNVGRGLRSTGNSPLAYTSGGLGGNTAGNYDLGGNSDYIDCTQLNSGGMSGQLGPGPITG